MVLIVNYGMGNLRSVANALEALGAPATISDDPGAAAAADRIVLPGVGAFGEAMERLRPRWLAALEVEVRERRKPFLGICLGMQLLADVSFEHGEHRGFGWIPGQVRRLTPSDAALRVPHVGWNVVRGAGPSALLEGVPSDPTFYFVHSYAFAPSEPAVGVGVTEYGGDFVSVVEQGHIFGTQFHPEKSQKSGLQLLRNFLARC
jgi:glutamine amidotransferase